MKNLFKKMLVLVMSLAFVTTVFAAANGKITVDNAVKGETYSIYKIFDLESFDKEKGTYAYKITEAWESFFKTGAGASYVNIDEQGYVTATDALKNNTAEFAKLALAFAKEKNIATAADPKKATSAKVEFTGLELGYYLLDTSLGTLCSLNTTDTEVVIKEKNGVPSIDKTVEENSTKTFGKTNDANIGDTVNFKAVITAKVGAQNYVMHDTMDAGLTFNDDVAIAGLEEGKDYNVVTDTEDNCTFEVVFTQAYLDTITSSKTLTVTYSAVLNEKANVITSNDNTTHLTYGEGTNTTDSTTKTYTWKAGFEKYTKVGENNTPLAGVKFVFSTSTDEKDAISLVAVDDTNHIYRVAKAGETGTKTIVTNSTGEFIIQGLDARTYYLIETEALPGYNKLASPVTVTITSEESESHDARTFKVNGETSTLTGIDFNVLNTSGVVLPTTGGFGTTLLVTLGSILFAGAALILITKKRMYNAN